MLTTDTDGDVALEHSIVPFALVKVDVFNTQSIVVHELCGFESAGEVKPQRQHCHHLRMGWPDCLGSHILQPGPRS